MRCESCNKITPEGDLVLDGTELRCKATCATTEIDSPIKFIKHMDTVLAALNEHEASLYPGTTMGEIKAAGGTWRALSKAMEYGWANSYGAHSGREAPAYYRTKKGTRALEAHQAARALAEAVANMGDDGFF